MSWQRMDMRLWSFREDNLIKSWHGSETENILLNDWALRMSWFLRIVPYNEQDSMDVAVSQ